MISRRYKFVMRLHLAAAASLAALLVLAGGASAAWPSGASFVSGSSALGLQAAIGFPAADATVSADGKFAVFRSTSPDFAPVAAPDGGIFRKNLLNDSAPIEVVVPYPASNLQCGPKLPSVSGNGRYIAFSSGVDGLVASDTNGRQDVFVRDMSVPIASPGAFDLVSALDDSDVGAEYTVPVFSPPVDLENECGYGAKLTQNVGNAISNDGSKVVFTNNAFTNMDSPTAGNGTAPGQLWVRDRVTNETKLHTVVSEVIESPDPSVDPGAIGEPLSDPREFNSWWANAENYLSVEPRANISGDGSTIAWSGVWARSLVKSLTAEEWEYGPSGGPYNNTRLLLWKRIADGPSAEIRRVSGIADLDDAACVGDPAWVDLISDEEPINATEAACRGPLRADEGEQCIELAAPQMTYDGFRVFFTTCAELRGDQFTNIPNQDVMVSNMSPGVTRKAGTKQLTYSIEDSPAEPRIENFAASDDGNRVAIVTGRSDFSGVSSIPFTGTSIPVGTQRNRMFLIDGGCDAEVHNGTIEWIARPSSGDLTKAGGAAGVGTGVLGLDADGSVAGFVTTATNLVAGHNGEVQALSVADSTAGCADTMDPTISISAPTDGSMVTDEDVTLRYTVSDDSGDATCDLADGSSQPLSPGLNTITVTCTDAAGNDGSASVDVTHPDVTGPTVVITSPANGSTVGLTPTLNYTATDDSGTAPDCDLVNGSALGPYAAGPQSVTVTCEDAANNVGSATSNFTAASDTTAPAVTITSPANGSTTGVSPTLLFTVTDNDPTPDCDLVNGSTLGPLPAGGNSVTVTCEDASGNIGSATSTFTVQLPTPPPPPVDTTPPPAVASLSLMKSKIKGTSASIPVEANLAGSLSAIGKAKLPGKGKKKKKLILQKAGSGSASATPGGATTIKFKLSSAAKKYLAKKKKLSVSVMVTYTPTSGAPVTKTVKLNFKAAKKKKKKK